MTDRMRTGKTGRDSKGRFIKGNPGGPGRPPAASAHEHRRAMLAAVRRAICRRCGQPVRSELKVCGLCGFRMEARA